MATTLVKWTAAAALLPTTSAPGVLFVQGTNFPHVGLEYDQSVVEQAYFHGIMPQTYTGGTITCRWFWTSGVTGNVVWFADMLGRIDDEVFDSALGTGQYVVTDSVTAIGDLMVASNGPLSAPDVVAGDYMIWKVARFATDAGDTAAGDARLLGFELEEG